MKIVPQISPAQVAALVKDGDTLMVGGCTAVASATGL